MPTSEEDVEEFGDNVVSMGTNKARLLLDEIRKRKVRQRHGKWDERCLFTGTGLPVV